MSLAHYFNGKADKRPRVRTCYCQQQHIRSRASHTSVHEFALRVSRP